jgi:hypothetical protein
MKKLTITILILFLVYGIASSQRKSCLPEGITFRTQEQIDNFQINYPGCTEIEGDVYIGHRPGFGSDIVSLDSLNVLTSIGGDLAIHDNQALVSLSGLEVETFILEAGIRFCPA